METTGQILSGVIVRFRIRNNKESKTNQIMPKPSRCIPLCHHHFCNIAKKSSLTKGTCISVGNVSDLFSRCIILPQGPISWTMGVHYYNTIPCFRGLISSSNATLPLFWESMSDGYTYLTVGSFFG